MASAVFPNSVIKAKFRGCMVGALLGDCLGLPFEPMYEVYIEDVNDFLNKLISGEQKETLKHSDDTRMTISVASSIIAHGEINTEDIARRFVDEFFSQPHRCYGAHVRIVFKKLKNSNFEDIFLPAKQQFEGLGSYGNGAAMRTAPIALFGNSGDRDEEYIMNATKQCALITHAHQDGYNGALLQCLAISAALKLDSSQKFNPICFIDGLLKKMKNIEKTGKKPYCEKLKKVKKFCRKNPDSISSEKIIDSLGNGDDISALKSVPTAIYAFLRGMKPIKDYVEYSNPFLRTLLFAISLGGDTDTIATMAGSIAGAYYGEEIIPEVMQKGCESIDEIILLADKLFDVTYKKE